MQTTERKFHFPDNFDLWIFSVWIRSRYKVRLLEKRVVKIIVIYDCSIVT